MNRNAVSTLLSLGILFVVIYMFKDQLKAVFSSLSLGTSTRGMAIPGAFTVLQGIPLKAPNGDTLEVNGRSIVRVGSGVDNTGAGNTGGLGISGSD